MNGTPNLSRRDRRALVAGLATMICIVGASRVVPRWREWDRASRETAAAVEGDVGTLEAQLRRLPRLRDSMRVSRARAVAARARLIEAPTVAAAGARLATEIGDIADDLGVRVGAVQIRPDTLFRGGFAHVAVTLSASGDVEHLADLLQSLESSTMLLAVRELTVTPTDVLSPDERPEILRFQLVVEALAVQGKGDPDDVRADSVAWVSESRVASR